MFVGDAYYGKVDHVPGQFYVATRFLHCMWMPVVPRESYVIRDDGTRIAVRIPLRWKSVFLAWFRTSLFLAAATFLAAGIAFVRIEPLPGKTHPVTIGLVLWGIVIGLSIIYLFTYRLCRAAPHRATELGAVLGISRDAIDERYVSDDATTVPPHSREVVAEIAANVRDMSATTFEAAGEAAGEAMSITLVVGISLLLAIIGIALGAGILYVVTLIATASRLVLFATTLIVAGAPVLLVVLGRRSSLASESFLGESRGVWLAVCCGAWILGAALSLLLFL